MSGGYGNIHNIIIVSRNRNKVEELKLAIKHLYPDLGVEISSSDEYRKLEIQSENLIDIALKALKYVVEMYNPRIDRKTILVVEDSGLFIDSLKGFPGPYTSYVYKSIGISGILKILSGIDNRSAKYMAAMAFYNPEQGFGSVEGVLSGYISNEPRGSEGFGFDPIFIPEGYGKTLAELGLEVKIRISHRTRALINLLKKTGIL